MSKKKLFKLLTFILFVLFIVITDKFSFGKKVLDSELFVHFIDVGQGDSIFIENEKFNMLIDAGEDKYGEQVVNYIKEMGYDKIDFLVGTHPHTDHIGGLSDVVDSFEIGTIYMPKVVHSSKTYENLLKNIKSKNKTIKTAKKGVIVYEDETTKIEILSPIEEKYEELNNYSVVVKLIYGETSFLFMGDAESLIEKELVGIEADVVKIAHHGSDTSSYNDFVKRVNAKYGIIQVGESNQYNLPNNNIVKRWENQDTLIYRTDKHGDVVVRTDGLNIEVNKEK